MDANLKASFEEFLQFKEYLRIKEELLKPNPQLKKDPIKKESESSPQPGLFDSYRTVVNEHKETTRKPFVARDNPTREEKNKIIKAIAVLWSKKGINAPGCVEFPNLSDPFYDSDPDLEPLKKFKSLERVRDWLIFYLTAHRKAYRNIPPHPGGFLCSFGLLIKGTQVNDEGLFIKLDHVSNVLKDKH